MPLVALAERDLAGLVVRFDALDDLHHAFTPYDQGRPATAADLHDAQNEKAGALLIARAPAPCNVCALLELGDLICLHALLALGRLVGDLVTLFEGLEPCTLYAGVVHKEIL